jgi:hypothetical protein
MKSYTVTATDEATLLVDADDTNRTIYVQTVGNTNVYLGGANVTSTNGLLFVKHTQFTQVFIPLGETLYVVCAEDATEDVRVLTPDPDDASSGLYAEPEPEEEEEEEPTE